MDVSSPKRDIIEFFLSPREEEEEEILFAWRLGNRWRSVIYLKEPLLPAVCMKVIRITLKFLII